MCACMYEYTLGEGTGKPAVQKEIQLSLVTVNSATDKNETEDRVVLAANTPVQQVSGYIINRQEKNQLCSLTPARNN